MGVTTTKTNKPFNPRGNDQSPKGYNRAKLYSGKALDFDGVNDRVVVSDFMTDNADFSVSFYLKINTFISGRGVLGTWDESYNGFGIGTHSSGYLRSWANDGSNGGMNIVSQSELGTTEYHHIVLTYDYSTGTQSGYFNGVYKVSETFVDTMTHSVFHISYLNSVYGFNDINVAGVKVFNEVLTAAQIADLYNNPEKIVPTGVDNTALKLWLPMMEGAGTTAYDGSGNGNHGTIAGATYVNGVGAPVAQTSVIDWNKGTNLTPNSEDLGLWIFNFVTVTTNATTAPDGQTTADKIIIDSNSNFHRIYRQSYSNTTTNDLAFSVYLKYNDHQHVSFGLTDDGIYRAQFVADLVGGTITDEHTDRANVVSSSLTDVGNGWYKLEGVITPTTAWGNNIYTMLMFQNSSTFSGGAFTSSGTSVYAWGAQSEFSSNNGPYVLTFNSSQDSAVFLPQGLTTGRDITGVNLFENVRKQGALNLDGSSWAEVHDNASLDITTAITLECWFYDTDEGAFEGVIGKWKDATQRAYAIIKNNGSNNFLIRVSTDGSAQAGPTITNTDYGWIHLVMTYDGANVKGYKNGVYQSQVALTGSIATNDLPVEIGRYGQSTNSQYNNQIAQPRIYNRALTASEVLRNYNSGKNTYTNS